MSKLFSTVAEDVLDFGRGNEFNARKVVEWMALDNNAVSRLAAVSPASVRYDDAIPRQVKERLEDLANLANLVATAFGGDSAKAEIWFRTSNPMLGGIVPREMVRLGRSARLHKFIVTALSDEAQATQSRQREARSA